MFNTVFGVIFYRAIDNERFGNKNSCKRDSHLRRQQHSGQVFQLALGTLVFAYRYSIGVRCGLAALHVDSSDYNHTYLRYGDGLLPLCLQHHTRGIRPRLYHHYDLHSSHSVAFRICLFPLQPANIYLDDARRLPRARNDNGGNGRHRCFCVDTVCVSAVQATPRAIYGTQTDNRTYQYRIQSVLSCRMSEVAADRPRTYRLVLQPCLQGRIYRNIQLLVIVHRALATNTRYFHCKMAFRFRLASQDVTLLDTAAYARHRRHNEPDHRPTAFPLHLPRYARGGEGAARSVSGLFQDSYGNDDVYLRFPLRLRAVHIRQKRAKRQQTDILSDDDIFRHRSHSDISAARSVYRRTQTIVGRRFQRGYLHRSLCADNILLPGNLL